MSNLFAQIPHDLPIHPNDLPNTQLNKEHLQILSTPAISPISSPQRSPEINLNANMSPISKCPLSQDPTVSPTNAESEENLRNTPTQKNETTLSITKSQKEPEKIHHNIKSISPINNSRDSSLDLNANQSRTPINTQPILNQESSSQNIEDNIAAQTKALRNNAKSSTPKPTRIIPIIIDNIKTKYTREQIIKELHIIFNDIKFDTNILTKGGIQIIPHHTNKNIHHVTNTLLQSKHYPPNIFGSYLYIHIEDNNDTRPWLCINKVPTDVNINDIKEKLLHEHNIQTDGMHRKSSPMYQSTLVKFKVQHETQQKTLIDQKINIFNRTLVIRKYIKVDVTRCTNCQELTHLRGACHKAFRCVRCASPHCPRGACRNGTLRRCVNCGGNHPSNFKNCTALKNIQKTKLETKKTATYAQALKKDQARIHQHQNTQQTQINELQKEKEKIIILEKEIATIKEDYQKMQEHFNTLITGNIDLINKLNSTPPKTNTSATKNNNINKDITKNKSDIQLIKKEVQDNSTNAINHTNYSITRLLKKVLIPLITKTVINHQSTENYNVLLRHTTTACQQLIPSDLDIKINNINPTDSEISTSEISSSDEEEAKYQSIINRELDNLKDD